MSKTLRVIFGSVAGFMSPICDGQSVAQGYQAGADFADYVSTVTYSAFNNK